MRGLAQVREAASALRGRLALDAPPAFGLVLGSGLSGVRHRLENAREVVQDAIPHVPVARVPGHHGMFAAGTLQGVSVLACAGRCHAYEGHSLADVAFVVRLLHELGARTVVLTAATGGIHPELSPGDLVLVADHLNLMAGTPLSGSLLDGGVSFLDLTECYDGALRGRARDVAAALGLPLREGVLAAVRGPQFETPAEIRMLRILGADMVCMSLVPEAIVARHLGMSVLGIGVVANAAAGLGPPIAHDDVLDVVARRAEDVARLLGQLAPSLRAA